MPDSRKYSEIAKVIAPIALVLALGGFVPLVGAGLLLSFWLILPVGLTVIGLIASGKLLYDSYQARKEKMSAFDREESVEASEQTVTKELAASTAATKLKTILRKNGLDFEKAGGDIVIKSADVINQSGTFYLLYEPLNPFKGWEKVKYSKKDHLPQLLPKTEEHTKAQQAEFNKGEQMIEQLLPNTKENSAIQVNEVMALDDNVKCNFSSLTSGNEKENILSSPVFSPPTSQKPPFPESPFVPAPTVVYSSNSPNEEDEIEFQNRIIHLFGIKKENEFSQEELEFLMDIKVNFCADPSSGQKMLFAGNYYEFYSGSVDKDAASEWVTWLSWVKSQLDEWAGWYRSGPNEALHVNAAIKNNYSTIKLVVRSDAVENLLEAKKASGNFVT